MTVQSSVAIRPLTYADLPQVMAIERRSFPTPWSLSMFVLELSRASGVCLAATEDEDGRRRGITGRIARPHLLAYLVCSEYGDDWHIMNIAVDLEYQRHGLATALLAELYARVDDPQARFTLEVRRSNAVAIHLYEREGFRARGLQLDVARLDEAEYAGELLRTVEPGQGGGPVGRLYAGLVNRARLPGGAPGRLRCPRQLPHARPAAVGETRLHLSRRLADAPAGGDGGERAGRGPERLPAGRPAGPGGCTAPPWRRRRPHGGGLRSDLTLWRESLPLSPALRLCSLPLASPPDS